ncbi:hypothetical protein [Neisseria sp.]|uniref:hypothetical protein n=2 Tax=Neisseria sp. TaxID=192066 RepID=UPI0035A18C8A
MSRIKTALFSAAGLMILTACMPHNAGKTDSNPEKGTEKMEQENKGGSEQAKQQRCRSKLHKAESRDDLLKQMYETAVLDDCLYAMDVEELEKIWGIPVRMVDPNDRALLKDLHSPIGLHIIKDGVAGESRAYYLKMTKSEFHRTGTLFPEGRFPAFLPKPEGFEDELGLANRMAWIPSGNPYIGPEDGPIRYNWQYFWRTNGRIMEAWHWFLGAIGHMEFHEHANGRFD